MLEDIDNDLVRRLAIGKASDTHQRGDLPNGDVDGRSGHERGDCSQRDEVDNPPSANQTDGNNHDSTNDTQGRGHNMTLEFRIGFSDPLDDITGHGRHDSDGLERISIVCSQDASHSTLTPIVMSFEVAKNQ